MKKTLIILFCMTFMISCEAGKENKRYIIALKDKYEEGTSLDVYILVIVTDGKGSPVNNTRVDWEIEEKHCECTFGSEGRKNALALNDKIQLSHNISFTNLHGEADVRVINPFRSLPSKRQPRAIEEFDCTVRVKAIEFNSGKSVTIEVHFIGFT